MRALRKRKISAKHVRRAAVPVAAQISALGNGSSSVPVASAETFSQIPAIAISSSVMLPLFHPVEGNPAEAASAVSGSDDAGEEDPAIVAQIRALCSTASSATSATTREI
jgi:hypothetical protein